MDDSHWQSYHISYFYTIAYVLKGIAFKCDDVASTNDVIQYIKSSMEGSLDNLAGTIQRIAKVVKLHKICDVKEKSRNQTNIFILLVSSHTLRESTEKITRIVWSIVILYHRSFSVDQDMRLTSQCL